MPTSTLGCPRCGSRRIVPSTHGFPAPDTIEPLLAAMYNDALVPGGLVIRDEGPEWRCRACGHAWSASRAALRDA